MTTKIYDVTIGRKVWLTRDAQKHANICVWVSKPKQTVAHIYGKSFEFWSGGVAVNSLCSDHFARITGFDMAPGECVGPVYIGVVSP